MAAAAIDIAMFLGLTAPITRPVPKDFPVVNEEIPAIHFGWAGSSPCCGRLASWRWAPTARSTPSRILIQNDAVDAVESELDRSCDEATATRTPRIAVTPMKNPITNAPAFGLGRSVNSSRITAMIGTGEIVMAIAKGRISPMTFPT